MESLYNHNGLLFFNEEQIQIRKMMENHFVPRLRSALKSRNRAWDFFQIEAPLLTPKTLINPNYTNEDMFIIGDLVLRPETTMGSYVYAKYLLEHHTGVKMPFCVWQHGKSFRQEQDQPLSKMKLKEFYQMEFQCIYALNTKDDYSLVVVPAVQQMIAELIGPCHIEPSDRLPDYAIWTKDVICEKTNMEVCSISQRKDFPNAHVLEVAIGTDRCIYNFQNKISQLSI